MKFTTGMITGAIIGAAGALGAGYAIIDRHTRKKLARRGHRFLDKANNAIETFTDM